VTRSDSKTRSVRGELSIRSRTDLQAEQAECLGVKPRGGSPALARTTQREEPDDPNSDSLHV